MANYLREITRSEKARISDIVIEQIILGQKSQVSRNKSLCMHRAIGKYVTSAK